MTTTPDVEAANPFEDPVIPRPASTETHDAAGVLTVDRNAVLTLGTDALIVLDEGLRHRRAASNCCGLLPQRSKTTRAIPFYNVLWAELSSFEVTIHYAQSTGKKSCAVATIIYTITDKTLHVHAQRWVDALLERAYPAYTKRQKRMKVLVNPFGGQGYAHQIWARAVEPIFAAAQCKIDVERTAYRGHAVEIAEQLDVDAYDLIACASGDGLPHEVFNGLARQKNARRALRQVAVVQIPCGSGNAMSLNLNGTDSPSLTAVAIVKGMRTPMDLTAITQGNSQYYSFLSQAVGIVADVDLGTESLRWMGSFRFTWGVLVRLLGQTIYPAELSVAVETDDKLKIKQAYRQTYEEQAGRGSNELRHGAAGEDLVNADETQVPVLRYGTVHDELHQDFETEDMPTLGNFFVGNMCWMSPDSPFFATALPYDGKLDMINIDGLTPRMTSLRMVINLADGSLMDCSETSYRKVSAYRISPRIHQTPPKRKWRAKFGRWIGGGTKQKEGLIAIDGERVPFEPFQAEVVPGLGTVLSKRGAVYEFDGRAVAQH